MFQSLQDSLKWHILLPLKAAETETRKCLHFLSSKTTEPLPQPNEILLKHILPRRELEGLLLNWRINNVNYSSDWSKKLQCHTERRGHLSTSLLTRVPR